jgi:hypothetical protein
LCIDTHRIKVFALGAVGIDDPQIHKAAVLSVRWCWGLAARAASADCHREDQYEDEPPEIPLTHRTHSFLLFTQGPIVESLRQGFPKAPALLDHHLFYGLGLEVDKGIVFDGITDLERIAANLTVFDVGVTVDREVQDHRNICAAKGTGEGVFDDLFAS